ncbi:MAG: hypothetical protein A2Y33_06900 [Spirochaetes bacterium GWF1_51_8]|nr:MAG: hypothetical protein A2Y33_06900 [Spirochaetes bacterium GWF1_51_8]
MPADWMKELANFETVLNELTAAVESLVSHEEQKYDALKQIDVKKLMELNSEEEILMQQLDGRDKKRAVLINRMAREFGIEPSAPLSELITQFPLEMQERFHELRRKIKRLSTKLETAVRENSRLIQNNLNIINFTLNFANRGAVTETYNYRERGEGHKNLHIVNRIA